MALDDWKRLQERIFVTVDVVPLTISEGRLCVLLHARRDPGEPYHGAAALLGGAVHPEEDPDAEATAVRVLARKAGLSGLFLEQLRTFAGATRDPRGWSLSVAYFALVPYARLADSLGPDMFLRPAEDPGQLAFDHAGIVAAALERVRGKGAYSTLPARLLPIRFTLDELRRTYETVTGERLDKSSFRRKVMDLDFVQEIPGERDQPVSRRPAQLYCLKPGSGVFERRI